LVAVGLLRLRLAAVLQGGLAGKLDPALVVDVDDLRPHHVADVAHIRNLLDVLVVEFADVY
ncbi:MAG: hypothetical protein R6U78_04855, partial [Bacteroidales bacterium]